MPPVRIGVIGAGWFASRRHCPDILAHPQATLLESLPLPERTNPTWSLGRNRSGR